VERFHIDAASCAVLTSYEDFLKLDLDGVFVVTPPATHAEVAVAALQAGKHVFVEKPLAVNLEQCYRIKFEAQRLRRVVMVGHTFIYHAAVRKFKESLPMVGALRTIYTVRANFGQYQEGGLINDLLPHDLSIFNFLCGGFPTSVKADVNRHQDVAFVTAEYGPVTCNAFLSWATRTRRGNWRPSAIEASWNGPGQDAPALPQEVGRAGRRRRYKHFDEGTQNLMIYDQSEPLTVEALHFRSASATARNPSRGSRTASTL